MHQPRFFADLAFFAFFPLAGGSLDRLLFGDIFAVPGDVLLAGKSADMHHHNRLAPANSSGRYKKSGHTAGTKQPSVECLSFFRSWPKTEAVIIWRCLLGFRIYGMSLERLEVAASGLSFVMTTFPLLSIEKGRKGIKYKEKRGRRDNNLELHKKGRKANREEKTQHN